MDKVSVIIPVYNCEKFLKHTVQSVLNQTYTDWEMIIVNDASTDNSGTVAAAYAAADKRIRVINQPQNSGVGACRNRGIEAAEGRYVAFLDSDDLWSREKLSKQVEFMRQNDAAASHTGFAFMSEKGEVLSKGKVEVDPEIDLVQYMKTTQIGLSTVMIDREKIPDIRFPEERELCEDAKTWVGLFHRGYKFYGLNEELMLYRVRQNQLSGNKIHMAVNTLKRYLREDNLPAYKRLYCFLNYAYNGTMKRMNKTRLSPETIQKFNCRDSER